MACCTGGMAEGAALPRGDTEDTEVRQVFQKIKYVLLQKYAIFLSCRSTENAPTLGILGPRKDTGTESHSLLYMSPDLCLQMHYILNYKRLCPCVCL